MTREGVTFWNLEVTVKLDELVEKAVEEDWYVSKSELIRDACRRLLDEINLRRKEMEKSEIDG